MISIMQETGLPGNGWENYICWHVLGQKSLKTITRFRLMQIRQGYELAKPQGV